MSSRLAQEVGAWTARRPIATLLVVAVLTALAVWNAAARLRVQMDVATLLPEDSEVLRATRNTLRDYYPSAQGLAGLDFLMVVLHLDPDGEPMSRADGTALLRQAAPVVRDALNDLRYFRNTPDPGKMDLREDPAALLALATELDFDHVEGPLLAQNLPATLRDLEARWKGASSAEQERLRQDPFGILSVLEARSRPAVGPLQTAAQDGFLLSDDGEMLLFTAWPIKSSTDLISIRQLRQFLHESRDGLMTRHSDWRGRLKISFVGPHIENAEGTADVRQDVLMTSALSLVSVLLLFVVAFRQPEATLLVAVPLLVGLAWSLGVTAFFVPRITQVTLTFAAILIGLGIDFSIHLYNRYLEEVRLGREPEKAMAVAFKQTGPSIVAGAVTTIIGFLAMATTRFVGFRELGLFGAIGIFMCLVAVVVVLPPLIMLVSRWAEPTRVPIATLGLKKVAYMVEAYPRMTVAGGLCILMFLGLYATQAEMEDDLRTLRQPSDSYTSLVKRIGQHFTLPSTQLILVQEDDNLERLLEQKDVLWRTLAAGRKTYGLVEVDSLRLVLPSAETQTANLRRAAGIRLPDLKGLLGEHPGLPADIFDSFIDTWRTLQAAAAAQLALQAPPITLERMEDPEFIRNVQRYLTRDEIKQVYRVITHVYPPPDKEWLHGVPTSFREGLAKDLDRAPLVLGTSALAAELRVVVVRDLAVLVLLVLASVVIFLITYLRDGQRVLLAMVPVLFSTLCLLGAVKLLNMRLNYLNVIVLPMIIGITAGSSIHILARYFEERRYPLKFAVERTGRAVAITGLTTAFGFGALSAASFEGIREIGVLAVVGILAALFAALLFLPAILQLRDPNYSFTGGPGDEIG